MNKAPTLKKKDIGLSALSGLLLALPFANGDLWIFAWFGFIPLFLALEKKSKPQAFILAYFTGLFFWWLTIYWLAHVTLLGTIVFIFYLALYSGFFGLFFSRLSARNAVFLIPAAWVVLEYLRSHIIIVGFPWALLGYSQYQNLPVIQIADITGAWGVSFLVMMVNVALWKMFVKVRRQAMLCVFIMAAVLGYGYLRLYTIQNRQYPIQEKIALIQGNIPQELKWEPGARPAIVEKYLTLTRKAAAEEPGLIVWPEASLPVILEEEPAYFQRVRDEIVKIKIPLLLGAVTASDGLYYNSAVLVSSGGAIAGSYSKLHLVPFGEYIPLKKALPFLQTIVPIGDVTPGKEYKVFNQYPFNFSVLICFEDLFPELSRRFVQHGANLLVNITNDAWYKRTSAPYQHLQASVFRAIENRVPVVRAANTGISGYIASSGKQIFLAHDKSGRNIFVDAAAVVKVAISPGAPTVYNRLGDAFIGACVFLLLYGIIANSKREIET